VLTDAGDDAAREKHEALLVLSRRILIYIAGSTLANIAILLPLPFVVVGMNLVRACVRRMHVASPYMLQGPLIPSLTQNVKYRATTTAVLCLPLLLRAPDPPVLPPHDVPGDPAPHHFPLAALAPQW